MQPTDYTPARGSHSALFDISMIGRNGILYDKYLTRVEKDTVRGRSLSFDMAAVDRREVIVTHIPEIDERKREN
jgi:hypothetical protein